MEGQTSVGFGNSDILVRRDFSSQSDATACQRGNQSRRTRRFGAALGRFRTPANGAAVCISSCSPAKAFWLASNIVNAQTPASGVIPGTVATLTVGSGPRSVEHIECTLFMNDRPVPISSVSGNQVNFNVPASTAPGPYILRIEANGERSLPILMIVEPPPPKILSASSENGDNNAILKPGQLIAVKVSDMNRPDRHWIYPESR